jgi:hypothetical protein
MVGWNPVHNRFDGDSNIDPDRTLLDETWFQITSATERGRGAFENVDRVDNLDDAFQIPPGGSNALRPRFAFFRLHGAYANPNAIIPEQGPADPTVTNGDGVLVNSRLYPIAPVVVSAGPDGEFGMYLEPSGTATEPTDLSVRCGRVDCTSDETLGQFLDNILSIKVRSGANQ